VDSATSSLYIPPTRIHKAFPGNIVLFPQCALTEALADNSDSPNASHPASRISRRISGLAARRQQDLPPARAPICLRTAQDVHVSKGQLAPSWSRRFALVQWVISGMIHVSIAGHRYQASPGDVAIFLPSGPMDFRAVQDVNEICWFTVDGPLFEQFFHQLDLRPGVYHYGPPPIERIHVMIQALNDPAPLAHRRGSLLAIETLYELADRIVAPDVPGVVFQARHFIDQNFDNPDLSAGQLADTLDYHPGSLSRLFHKHTGITVIDYITQVRLDHAKSLLQHTDEKVSSIARQCGFRETTYFCRWLRKHAGVTARHLRATS